jgi:hypothetical protein
MQHHLSRTVLPTYNPFETSLKTAGASSQVPKAPLQPAKPQWRHSMRTFAYVFFSLFLSQSDIKSKRTSNKAQNGVCVASPPQAEPAEPRETSFKETLQKFKKSSCSDEACIPTRS